MVSGHTRRHERNCYEALATMPKLAGGKVAGGARFNAVYED
jgi:hypothetical protein